MPAGGVQKRRGHEDGIMSARNYEFEREGHRLSLHLLYTKHSSQPGTYLRFFAVWVVLFSLSDFCVHVWFGSVVWHPVKSI